MAKILIIYDSESDRKFTSTAVPYVKEGVEQVSGMEIRVRHVDEAETEDVFWADGIAIGCPTHLGGISWKMKKWWKVYSLECNPGFIKKVDSRPRWKSAFIDFIR